MEQKKAIVFFSAGLGDAVLLIPLIKELKKRDFHVTGLFNSAHPCEEIFEGNTPLDALITGATLTRRAATSIQFRNTFEFAYLNYFASNRKNFLMAKIIARQIITNRLPKKSFLGDFSSGIIVRQPKPGMHDAEQNLLLLDNPPPFNLDQIKIHCSKEPPFPLPGKFIAVQVSTANAKAVYKNWPVGHWNRFFGLLGEKLPGKKFVLLGDSNEQDIAEEMKACNGNLVSLAGKTSVAEAMAVIKTADLFVGLDGGLMHIAVALGKPSFTLWGASSERLYGYQQFDPLLHRCLHTEISCRPCSAWMEPNRSRVSAPENCPDFACMQQLRPEVVLQEFMSFYNRLPQYAE